MNKLFIVLFVTTFFSCIMTKNENQPLRTKALSLKDKGLVILPDTLSKYKNVERIDLSMNKFTTIPKGLEQFKNLEVLTIAYGFLTSFDCDLVDSKKIKRINLLENKIEYLDSCICL